MKKPQISRRTLLKGIAAGGATVAIGLPTLDIFCNGNGTALAQGSAFPSRFGVWFWGNGNIPARWNPRTTGRNYELSTQLSGLLPVRDDVTVVTGTVARSVARTAHWDGAASLLSGTPLLENGQEGMTARTVDVLVRDAIGGDTQFSAIYAGVDPSHPGKGSVSFNGPGSTNPFFADPLDLYRQLFGEGFVLPGETPIIDPMWQLRTSALSAVMDETAALRTQLGAHDQRRLDQHLEGIRDIETRLLRFAEEPVSLASCSAPSVPAEEYPEVNSRVQMAARHRVIADLLTMALACDRTRVFHNMFTAAGTNVRFPGVATGHHELSHRVDPTSQDQLDIIMKQIMDEFAYFVGRLASVPEGDGRLIDHMAMLGTSDCAYGAEHTITEYPILVAGSAGGALVSGEHIRAPGELASKVAFSLMRAVGAGVASFGADEALATDGLPGLEV